MMQKRFSASDLILYLCLLAIGGLLLSVMYQVDRQWKEMKAIQTTLADQTREIREWRAAAATLPASVAATPAPATTPAATATTPVATPAPVATTSATAKTSDTIDPAFKRAFLATQKPDYAQGDWYVDAFGQELKTLTPLVSSDVYSSNVQSFIQESLLSRDPNTLDWQPFVAKSWDMSPDGLKFTFKLREGVSFSDGQPLTADDVAFSFEFLMTEAIAAARARSYFEKIASVKALDKYTVEFIYKEPYFEALDLAASMSIMPKHIYEPYLKKPEAFNQSKAILVGSGPYKLPDGVEWTPDKGTVELVRNERYWGPVKPSYNRLMWRIIKNDSARLTTYRNGEVDQYSAKPKEYQMLKEDKQISEKSQRFEYMPPVVGYSWIGWNQFKDNKATIFADKRVRQALTLLTDREAIKKDVLLGYAELAASPFSPTSKQHNPAVNPMPYDVTKAQALLKEAGFSDSNGDGILDKAGQPLEFKLMYAQSNEDTQRMVLVLKDLYAKAGVRLIPSPQEWPVMLEAMNKRSFEAITLAWTSGIETDIYQMFHGSQTKDDGDNFIGYKNPELDKLIDQARSTVDETKRMPLWQQAEAILHEDQPYTFLFRRQSLLFIDKRIKNIEMTKVGLNDGMLPLENYVPKPLQRYSQ